MNNMGSLWGERLTDNFMPVNEEQWKIDKKWSDKFLPEIKQIIGEHLITEPPEEEDIEHNTDLIVLGFDSIRVGCRIRKYEYFSKYPNDFTIRSERPKNGKRTELSKIIEGWGDYFFYGFSDQAEIHILYWRIISLNKFRLWFNRELFKNKGELPGYSKNNADSSSNFIAFDISKMPNEIIFKQKNI